VITSIQFTVAYSPKHVYWTQNFTHDSTDISSSSPTPRSTQDPGLQQDQFTDVPIPSYFSPASNTHFLQTIYSFVQPSFILAMPTDFSPSWIFLNSFFFLLAFFLHVLTILIFPFQHRHGEHKEIKGQLLLDFNPTYSTQKRLKLCAKEENSKYSKVALTFLSFKLNYILTYLLHGAESFLRS